MATLEISKQAFDELKDRLMKSDFLGKYVPTPYIIEIDDLGEIITFCHMSVQASQGFDNQEIKELKKQLSRLREPLQISPEIVRHAIEAVSDEKGAFSVDDVCELAIKIMEIKQRNQGEK